jgi:uncharacterized 2Fe-2S/4Fe-4S cluster protein (DUF4445 family)
VASKKQVKTFSVHFLPEDITVSVPDGTTILEAAHVAGLYVNSVCGGEGTCGKCKVYVKSGNVQQKKTAPPGAIGKKGAVLACQTEVAGNLDVLIPTRITESDRILVGKNRVRSQDTDKEDGYELQPLVTKLYMKIQPPSVESNIADCERLGYEIRSRMEKPALELRSDYDMLLSVPRILRRSDWQVTASIAHCHCTSEITQLERGDTSRRNFGLAIDVGTTTVVLHLVDVDKFATVDVEAMYNSQMRYGEDYIRRIIYAEEHDAFEDMKNLVLADINALIAKVVSRNNVDLHEITGIVVAGNTAMAHFLLGLDPIRLRKEPYVPSANIIPPLRATEVGIQVNPKAKLYVLPGVAAYVGADITAGVMSLQLDTKEETCLFIDIGTNGEVVLGNREWLVCSSCSAGPAFEGSGVEYGSRASSGAVESFTAKQAPGTKEGYSFAYSTIGNKPAAGFCGSGLLDIIAQLFQVGILDRLGKFNREIKSNRLHEVDGIGYFTVVPEKDSSIGKDITISEIDIENLMRSKAAVFAAISVLLDSVSLDVNDISRIYLAGAFGNYLNIESAITIGMLPDVAPAKVVFAGNTSVDGAKIALLSREAYEKTHELARKMTYYDLMGDVKFMDEFVKATFLPHTNIDLFPSVLRKTEKKA